MLSNHSMARTYTMFTQSLPVMHQFQTFLRFCQVQTEASLSSCCHDQWIRKPCRYSIWTICPNLLPSPSPHPLFSVVVVVGPLIVPSLPPSQWQGSLQSRSPELSGPAPVALATLNPQSPARSLKWQQSKGEERRPSIRNGNFPAQCRKSRKTRVYLPKQQVTLIRDSWNHAVQKTRVHLFRENCTQAAQSRRRPWKPLPPSVTKTGSHRVPPSLCHLRFPSTTGFLTFKISFSIPPQFPSKFPVLGCAWERVWKTFSLSSPYSIRALSLSCRLMSDQ